MDGWGVRPLGWLSVLVLVWTFSSIEFLNRFHNCKFPETIEMAVFYILNPESQWEEDLVCPSVLHCDFLDESVHWDPEFSDGLCKSPLCGHSLTLKKNNPQSQWKWTFWKTCLALVLNTESSPLGVQMYRCWTLESGAFSGTPRWMGNMDTHCLCHDSQWEWTFIKLVWFLYLTQRILFWDSR